MSEQQQIKKNAVVKPEEIARFLAKTGFVFEMRMDEALRKAGYTTEINSEFLDLEGNTSREIDIIASKVINDINVHLIVECKQSATDEWIFLCHKQMLRFYYAVKHLPNISVKSLREDKLFAHFSSFDRSIPLAHNYLCYTIVGEKKTEHIQIDECVHKLPKAVVDVASGVESGKPHLFFPVALFSGQMFAVFYKGELVVEESTFLQYFSGFESPAYREKEEEATASRAFYSIFPALGELEKIHQRGRVNRIQQAAMRLGAAYQLDFVTEAGLDGYLSLVEKQVTKVQTKNWPLVEENATKSL